jgi:hypothetical protein
MASALVTTSAILTIGSELFDNIWSGIVPRCDLVGLFLCDRSIGNECRKPGLFIHRATAVSANCMA